MINESNKTYISGTLAENVRFAYECHGENFYEFKVRVPRLSGVDDIIPVTISERIMPKDWHEGVAINALGEFRSYNKIENGKSKLMLTVFVRELLDAQIGKNPNSIMLIGYLCKQPNYRITPLNREIADILVAVNRAYNKSDYIPAIAWGKNAQFTSHLNVGEKVAVEGRIQSREYQKAQSDGSSVTMTAYEVSVTKIMLMEATDENAPWEWVIDKAREAN